MNENQIIEYIKSCERMITFFKKILDDHSIAPEPTTETEKLAELTNLRMLARSDAWPEAVPPDLICADNEKGTQARGILREFITTSIQNKRFLDFGCGEGYITKSAKKDFGALFSVGYDIKQNSLWDETAIFSNDFKKIKEHAPYDVIMAFDVLDHAKNPIEALKQMKLVREQIYGRIFVRFHPWTSRHGSHLYKDLNKAYLHLIFDDKELASLGLMNQETNKSINPLEEYRIWIKEAGLTVLEEKPIIQPIEIFFTKNPILARRIKNYNNEIMELQFVDYILK